MKIGLKSLIALSLVALTVSILGYIFYTSPHFFIDMNPKVGFVIGAFAVFSTYFCTRFWGMSQPSKYSLCVVGRKDDNPERIPIFTGRKLSASLLYLEDSSLELPGFLIRASYLIVFILVGCMLIDNRSVFIANSFPSTLESDKEFCPKEAETFKKPKPKPGCELVIKAFEMGYAKSLGDCDPRLQDGKIKEPKICEKRRHDEPYLHFASRLLERFWDQNISGNLIDGAHKKILGFIEKVKQPELLAFEQTKSLKGLPRASHHVFTNLEHPDGIVVGALSKIIPKESCQERVATAPPKYIGDPKDYAAESKLVSYSLDQILFNQRHAPGAGYCPEYIVHWNSDPDTCQRLAASPEDMMEELKIEGKVNAVVARIDATIAMARLEKKIEAIVVDPSAEKNDIIDYSGPSHKINSSRTGIPLTQEEKIEESIKSNKEKKSRDVPRAKGDVKTQVADAATGEVDQDKSKGKTKNNLIDEGIQKLRDTKVIGNSEIGQVSNQKMISFHEAPPVPKKPDREAPLEDGEKMNPSSGSNDGDVKEIKLRREIDRYISFQCVIEDEKQDTMIRNDFVVNYEGTEFNAIDLRVPRIDTKVLTGGKVLRTEYIERLSELIAPGFSNVGFESQANILDKDITKVAETIYQESDLFLTKLELLNHVDILKGNEWIKESEGMLDIYPWQLHLGNYVKRFRKTYKEKRGRL